MHMTISTLEYGAKAQCIIYAGHAAMQRDKVTKQHQYNHKMKSI
jgi:hypothetical protein